MRPRISPAALLVKVTARMLWGETFSTWHSHARRWMSTRVLPLPAPASTSTGPSGAVTAWRCASFKLLRIGERSIASPLPVIAQLAKAEEHRACVMDRLLGQLAAYGLDHFGNLKAKERIDLALLAQVGHGHALSRQGLDAPE